MSQIINDEELKNVNGGYETFSEYEAYLNHATNSMYKNDKGNWIYGDDLPINTKLKVRGSDYIWGTKYLEVLPESKTNWVFVAETFVSKK